MTLTNFGSITPNHAIVWSRSLIEELQKREEKRLLALFRLGVVLPASSYTTHRCGINVPLKETTVHMHRVKSSNVASVGYDPTTKILRVEFLSGGSYDYPDRTQADFDRLVNAESVGREVNALKRQVVGTPTPKEPS